MSKLPLFHLQGLAFGIIMTSLSVVFLKAAGLVTGQTAGIALLLSYVVPLGFGMLFFLVGLPFLVLAYFKRGSVFAVRTVIAVLGISFLSQFLSEVVIFEKIDPWLAAILAGACSGMGLVAIFRHNASAGGMTILAIVVEQRTGFKAGWFQLGVDLIVFLASALVLSPSQLFYSFIGALITNMGVVWNFDVAQSSNGRPGYGRAANTGEPDQDQEDP